jgi:hypothetical protein
MAFLMAARQSLLRNFHLILLLLLTVGLLQLGERSRVSWVTVCVQIKDDIRKRPLVLFRNERELLYISSDTSKDNKERIPRLKAWTQT